MENNIMSVNEMQDILGGLLKYSETTAESNALMMQKINQHSNLIGGLAKEINKFGDSLGDISFRLDNLELNEEITDEQRVILNQACKNRVAYLLDYQPELIDRYFRVYILDLYKSLKNNYGMGAKIATTRKRNYDRCMKGIESWYPNHENLRKRVDRKSKK